MTTRESLTAHCLRHPGDRDAIGALADCIQESPDCTPAEASWCEYARAWCEWAALRHDNDSETHRINKLSNRLAAHEASWRMPLCPSCRGGGNPFYGDPECRPCRGTGSAYPLSGMYGNPYRDDSGAILNRWRHRVEWEPLPVVHCALAELGEEKVDHVPYWQPSPWALACLRAGARFRVTDRGPWQPSDGRGVYCFWRESAWHRVGPGANEFGNLPDAVFGVMAETYPDKCHMRDGPANHQRIGFTTQQDAHAALDAAVLRLTLAGLGWAEEVAT